MSFNRMDGKEVKKRLLFWYSLLWILLLIALYEAYFIYFPDTTSTKSKWVGLFAGAVAVLTSVCKLCEILFYRYANSQILNFSKHIISSCLVWLKGKYKLFSILALALMIIFFKLFSLNFVICFIVGILCAIFCDFSFNFILSRALPRIPFGIDDSINCAYRLSYNLGISLSMISVGIPVCAIVILFHCYKDYTLLASYLLGFIIVVLFGNITNAISAKAVDNASAFLERYEYGINKCDKRNPLLILRGLCKNIFSSASFTFEFTALFLSSLIASMIIGSEAYNLMGQFLPIIIVANGIFACVIPMLFIKLKKITNPSVTLYLSIFSAVVIFNFLSYYCITTWLPQEGMGLAATTAAGSVGGLLLSVSNYKYTINKFKPVKNLANSALNGIPPLIIRCVKESFMSFILPVIIIVSVLLCSFLIPDGINAPLIGIWGMSLGIISIFATVGIMISTVVFSNVCKNASKITENFEEYIPEMQQNQRLSFIRETNIQLNSFCASFLNSSGFLCLISLFIAFTIIAGIEEVDILNPYVLSSIIIGVIIPFVFSSFLLGSVSKTSGNLSFDVERQLRKFPQILRFEMRPNYEKCIRLALNSSFIQTAVYCGIIVAVIYFVYKYLNYEALSGLIFGMILSSFCLSVFSSNSYALARSARNYSKEEFLNAEQTEDYSNLSATDAVFKSIKDLISCSLFALLKFIIVLAIVFAPFMN